jgi:acyl carrier protein
VTDAKGRIREFIRREFLGGRPLKDDEPLLDSGAIDSIGMVRLVTFLETEFRVTIKNRDIVPEAFKSVQALAKLVEGKKSK